jgi:hypothetical protein
MPTVSEMIPLMSQKRDAELLAMFRNPDAWSPQAIEAAAHVLSQRNVAVPPLPAKPKAIEVDPLHQEKQRKHRIREIRVGLFFVALGLVATIGTYVLVSSSPEGGTYLIMYGPVVYGLIKIARVLPKGGSQA